MILEGSASVRQDAEFFEAHKGDLIFFKTGVTHQFYNSTDKPMVFFALSNTSHNEVCDFPDSQKRTVREGSVRRIFQSGTEIADYWKDEENPSVHWPREFFTQGAVKLRPSGR